MNRGGGGGRGTPRGRSSFPRYVPVHPRPQHAGTGGGGSSNSCIAIEDRSTYSRSKSSSKKSTGSNSRQYEWKPKSNTSSEKEQTLQSVEDQWSQTEKLLLEQNVAEPMGFSAQQPDYFSSSILTDEKKIPSVSSVSGSKGKRLSEVSEEWTESSNPAESDVPSPVGCVYQQHLSSGLVDSHRMHMATPSRTPQQGNIKIEDLRPTGSATPSENFFSPVSSVSGSKGKCLSEVSEKWTESSNPAQPDVPSPVGCVYQQHVSSGHVNSHHMHTATPSKTPQQGDIKIEDLRPTGSVIPSEAFDICPAKTSTIMLKPSLYSVNRMHRNETKRESKGIVLRPGMVILKNYFSLAEQVKIIKKCRDLGLGSGGFYQPAYRDGAELLLKMMCLGKNWDPESSKYGNERPIDGAKPPAIPFEFYGFVNDALLYSHRVQKEDSKVKDEDLLPSIKPDICIVNFYMRSGRLGLHQDKDESSESIRKGLPVVSFSIGESARFEYSVERDGNSESVVLESGDVLIFGGKSRRIFHGVTSIISNSAPKALLEETQLRPGRLNLTFREY